MAREESSPTLLLESLADPSRGIALLDPLRSRILAQASEPVSASEIARRLRLPRQRVNYHVRRLSAQGFLRRSGRHRKRNMVEQLYVASARSFVLLPDLLGPLAADWRNVPDTASAAYLLALTSQLQSDVARGWRAADREGTRLSTLSIKSQFRFESAEQRADFARAIRQAVVDAVARFTSPDEPPGGRARGGEPYRLVLACYPYRAPEEPTES